MHSAFINLGDKVGFRDDAPSFNDYTPKPSSNPLFDYDNPANKASSTDAHVYEAHLPLGSTPDGTLLEVDGILSLNFGADTGPSSPRDVVFTKATTDYLENIWDSNGPDNEAISFALSNGGHTLTATRGSDTVFTATINVAANDVVTYTFTLNKAINHATLKYLDIPFNGLDVIDADGDKVAGNFVVRVIDDAPNPLVPINVSVYEDLYIPSGNSATNTFNTNADATGSNTVVNGTYIGPNTWKTAHGTAVVNADGTITYIPDADFSGNDPFTFTTTTDDGAKTYTVNMTVVPVSNDAPIMSSVTSHCIQEDSTAVTPYDLNLVVPAIKDATDDNGVLTGDNPERIGELRLALTGLGATANAFNTNAGAVLVTASGVPLVNNGSGVYRVVIVDTSGSTTPSASYHHAGVPSGNGAVNYLTAAEYADISVKLGDHRHENFNLNVRATSYEVDGTTGQILTGVYGSNINLGNQADDALGAGARNSESITIRVRAVTDNAAVTYETAITSGTATLVAPEADGVTLPPPAASTYLVAYSGATNRTADVTIYEERYFNLKDIMNVSFADLDGSEVRSITIGNPVGSGGTIRIDSGSGFVDVAEDTTVTIYARTGVSGQTGNEASFPDIRIATPSNFSGDITNVTITINALDTDSDGSNCGGPIAEADLTDNSVILNLHIPPRAGDVVAGDVSTAEDTAVAFLQHVSVTDTGTGDERINSVSFTVPTDWKVIAPPSSSGWSTTGNGLTGTYTITFDNSLTRAQREVVLDSFMIQPPAHSSKDVTINVSVTSTDTNTTGSDTATVNLPIKITVTPVAEVFVLTGSDPIKSSDWSTTNTDGSAANANEDGNGTPDLTMNPDHDYSHVDNPLALNFVDDRSITGYNANTTYAPNTVSYNTFIANNHFAVEDTPFYINQDGFFLEAGWFNEDGVDVTPDANGHKEETYATLSAYLDDKTTALAGGTFEYFNGTAWVAPLTIAGVSVPVIPMEFLDQVRFTPPANFSGAEIAIKVQAVTKDYDEDAPFTPVTAVTGVAWLTSIFVLPKADSVTIGVNPREVMDEDTTRALTIRMKSTDPTEVFDADIKGIIAGAKIEFAGYVYDTAADSSTWVNGADRLVFDSGTGKYTLQLHNLPTGTINPIYTPPPHSNDKNVLLNVDVVSKAEYNGFVTISPVQTLPIAISVLGEPDAPILTTATGLEWIENNIDEHNGNGTSNDVLSINGAPNLIALSIFIPGGVTGGELAQSPSDTSETITLRITDLPVGFELTDANGNPLSTLAGGSGDARVWVLTPAQIATTQIKTPVNYSGTVDFTVQPVVTENDGRATKFALQTVEFKITPSPEATLNLSSNVWEDEIGGNIGRIDLSTVIQNGDNVNDEIYEVRILAADVTARNLILYSDAAGTTPLDANGDGYYYIAQANLNSVYVRSPANYSGDINLNMDYIVRDTSSDTTLGPIYTGPTTAGLAVPSWDVAGGFNTISHTLHFRPVTDVVDMAFESFANTGGTVGIDIHAGHPQYTLAGTGTVTVNLDITKAIDVSSHEALNTSVSNERDYDYAGGAGEHITRIVIDGVPDGVTVDGATFLGGGQWQITAADGFTGQIDKAVTFNVNRAINDVDGRDIYMTVYTQDKDAAITTDTVIVNIKTNFTGGTTVILPTLDLSPLKPTVLEDDYNDPDGDGAGFALSKAVQLESVTFDQGASSPASYDLTVTIRTYPGDDTRFTGAGISGPITVIENAGTPQEQVVTLWIVTTTVTDANAQSTLQGILDDIRVITAEHGNINNLNRTVPIDVSAVFNSSGVARGDRVGGATDYDNTNPTDVAGADDAAGIVTITPVTDQATLTITQTAATNEGGTIPISITVSNEADESGDWDIVDGTVYFQLSAGTSAVIAGELQYTNGTPLSTVTDPAGLPSGTYYYITGATPDTLVNLQYVISQAGMTKYESGSFNLNAWAINQENGSTLQLLSDGTTTLTVNKVNTPPHITVMATGSENDGTPSTEGHIQLTINEIRMPADVGEVLSSAFIEGVPSGFIVYAGADEASAEATNLANNAGDGVWSLPVSGGDLPAYISIKPPAYWSGTVTSLSGLKLVLVSGESGLSPDATGFGFDLEVAPDADGIFALAPTYSFSNVGKPVSLNLNIGMEDPALIVVGAPDGNRELTRLIFTGIQDGANAVFLANNAMINPSRITYNAGTHTIEGLTQSELDTLQILHTPTSGLDPITVNAQTYEVDVDTGAIIDTSGLFGVQNFNLNVIGTTAIITDTSSGSPATPTAGNDYLTGSSSNDYINADAGNDIIFGADGEDSLVGGLGNDELHGGNDKDILLGGAGNDYLYGDAANDILHGGTGNDILTGGAGADTFVWGTGDNDNSIDVITDFDTGDMVDVSGLLDQLGWDNTMPTLSNFVTTHGTNTFDVHTADLSQTVHITVTGQTFTDLADLMAKTNLKID
ncbi:MAG: Ig-like domain-containing protein [Acinetobacter junii]